MSDGNLVLCGPMVRRVERMSVSVFVVTRVPCLVELRVHSQQGGKKSDAAPLATGSRATIKLGAGAHAAVVTAPIGDEGLQWGASYQYDLAFMVDGVLRNLYDDGVLVAEVGTASDLSLLRYLGHDLPGFALPPQDPAELRILHGSCRKPHGEGKDALAHGDTLVDRALKSKEDGPRPHQLFLTGDQIYADDVHLNLLAALTGFSTFLLGGHEESQELRPALGNDFDPGSRAEVCRQSGLSSGSSSSHLLSLGEFYAMYLFAWSQEPWQHPFAQSAKEKGREFYNALPKVRRLLANIATYMIFDDHEVTDDWYIRQSWCDAVLASPLGQRVIRNGLAAYLVFQHWGNDPAAFTPGTAAGAALAELDGWTGLESTKAQLDRLLPVPRRGADLAAPDPHRISWSWRWNGPGYEVVALDTRTKRSFADETTSLVPVAELDSVLPAPGFGLRFSLVLSAAPVLGVGLLEWVQKKATKLGWGLKLDDEPWAHGSSFRHLLGRLLARSPALVLSGDVHFSFGASLFDKAHPEVRIVNLTSSALKNMSGKLARTGLWALNFATDDQLQSALRLDQGAVCVATKRDLTEVLGAAYTEELFVQGAVLTTGSLEGDQPEVALQGARGEDRTDITGSNNLGDLRLDPAAGELVHLLWHMDNGVWSADRQVGRFALKVVP